MNKTFYPCELKGELNAPASKSEAHRRMICAGLSRTTTVLSGFMDSADMADVETITSVLIAVDAAAN